jgi:hypothetical protein
MIVAMRKLRKTRRFVRGLVVRVGKQTAVEYDRAARAAGTTKYPLARMLAFAFDGMSFSVLPLRQATYLGLLVGVANVLYAMVAVLVHFVFKTTVPDWTTTVVLVSLLFSVHLLVMGVLGEYVGRIYEQVKGRPPLRRRRAHPPQEDPQAHRREDLGLVEVPLSLAPPLPPPLPARGLEPSAARHRERAR